MCMLSFLWVKHIVFKDIKAEMRKPLRNNV